ncbi:hypothetical protein [Thermus scotoductus]|uniref:5'-nucleotidase n=1 Tax=Thermus scotoductus TaxID=37636 RepID=A0A430S2I1_THESC|nr:hypothetical protein [Thermus scotoductus]RTG91588.1 hypothetical protein CSW51_13535 [Thermus scotoductus]RTH27893.1 hypothetical protein CSW38_02305 [Thermus scotoductus]
MKAKPKVTRKRTSQKRAKTFTGAHALLLFPSGEDHKATLDLMRRFSAAVRYAYNRLLEGQTRENLKRQDGPLCFFSRLNTRHADDAVLKAQAVLDSARERGEDPRKVAFGGRKLFETLKRGHLSGKPLKELKREWREKRQGTLYSRGDKTKGGNLNLRLLVKEGALWLRINLGNGSYAHALVKTSHPNLNALLKVFPWRGSNQRVYASLPYNVELSLKDGKVYATFTWLLRTLEILLRLERPFLVNVNLPLKPKGFLWTRQSVRAYEGVVIPGEDPMGRPFYWFASRPLKEVEEGTDRWAVAQGFVSATPLRLDLTDETRLQPTLAHD